MKKKIILVSGDPNSINSEIIFKSWKKMSKNKKNNIFLISNFDLLKDQFKKLKYSVKMTQVKNIFKPKLSSDLKIINLDLKFKNAFKVPIKSSSKFVLKSLNLAHKLGLDDRVAGIVNCPINKNLLKKKIGVTEFLASKCLVKKNSEVMIIGNENLMVSPLTTHLKISEISRKLNKSIIIKKVKTINNWFKKQFGKKPKIAILGLNPHNDEYRFNSEEKKIIIPALKQLKEMNIQLSGPFPADTIFINDYKHFDIIVGMYHDQVLAPFKTLFKFNAINITLGLKYIRVSPDHGIAADKILQKKSNPLSLIKCIDFISKLN